MPLTSARTETPYQGAWNGTVIAELDDTAVVEGHVAFRRGVAVGESGAEDVFVRLRAT